MQAEEEQAGSQGDSVAPAALFACPAYISPEKAEALLTPQEAEVMEWLRLFQRDLNIGGTVEASTVREVLKVTPEELPEALKFVASKLTDRRRRDRHYRERVDFGFVLTVLRKDFRRPTEPEIPVPRRKDMSVASDAAAAISSPPICQEDDQEALRATRKGFSRAGDILSGSELLKKINER
jgi:hypothetical protein